MRSFMAWLVLNANANRTDDESGHGEAEEKDVVHGVVGRLSTAKMHAHPIMPS